LRPAGAQRAVRAAMAEAAEPGSATPGRSPKAAALPRVLTVWSMVGLIFFEVSGSTYGIEPVVRKAGDPWSAALGLAVVPLVWSVPIALMTAEMCSAYPHVGGKIYFVQDAFGPYVGWLNGAFNAVSNVFDVATLPAMALGYAERLGGEAFEGLGVYFAVAMVAGACTLNILGVELVGVTSYVFTILVCSPFLVLMAMGAPRLPLLRTEEFATIPMSRLKFLSCLLWNMSGYDDAGATAAEVINPQEVYPRSLSIAVSIVTGSYLLPVLVGLTVQPDVSAWRDGEFVRIGELIGGPVLSVVIALLGVLSCFGQLNALLCSSVREIVCLAELPRQPVPRFLAKLHPRFMTPHVTTVLFSCLLLLLVNADFTDLIAASMFFDCFSFFLQFAAWVKHRARARPGYAALPGEGGYRAPFGFAGVLAMTAFPVVLCLLAVLLTMLEHGHKGMVGLCGTFLVSSLVYLVQPRGA